MGDLEILMAMEQIRQLKARYYRFVDTKNWPEFRGLFTDDATLYFPESFGDPLPIAEAYPMIVGVLNDSISVHHGHMPEITVHDAHSATAIWAMEDQVYLPGDPATGTPPATITGAGHYHEQYRRVEGQWRIASLKLTRLKHDMLQQTTRAPILGV